eukprot:Pgem_evm1s451
MYCHILVFIGISLLNSYVIYAAPTTSTATSSEEPLQPENQGTASANINNSSGSNTNTGYLTDTDHDRDTILINKKLGILAAIMNPDYEKSQINRKIEIFEAIIMNPDYEKNQTYDSELELVTNITSGVKNLTLEDALDNKTSGSKNLTLEDALDHDFQELRDGVWIKGGKYAIIKNPNRSVMLWERYVLI